MLTSMKTRKTKRGLGRDDEHDMRLMASASTTTTTNVLTTTLKDMMIEHLIDDNTVMNLSEG